LFLAQDGGPQAGAGNCVACHVPPTFSDFRFHSTGASQEEYDAVHGGGAFAALAIPQLAERNARPELYLPPSPRLPTAAGRFRAAAASDSPGQTDLGLWNIWANPDVPAPQSTIAGTLGVEGQAPGDVLPRTIALFKTPGLRDLGQSAPYLHSGRMDSLEDVVRFYIAFSQKARLARVRNASPDLARIFLTEEAVAPLAAFLRSLNEDYQ